MQYVEQEQQHDGEIVGLNSPDNGRSCNQHVCCGRHVVPDHIVRFKTKVMEVLYQVPGVPEPDARIETVIKAVLVLDGTELCTIGFLPRHVAARPEEAARLHNKFAQIIEIYDGMASYILLDNVPAME
jgi:hypothetical protein